MSKKIDVSAFLPKISKPSKIGSNLSTVSTSSKLSLRRLDPPRQKDKFLATLSLVHRPVSEVPHAEDSSTVTDTAAASSASKTKPSSSKPSSPKPGPSCVPAKSPRKRVSPKPAQNHVKSGRISKGKQTHRLSYPIHTLLDDDVEVVDDPAPLPVDQKTPSKSPRKRPASATPSKSKTGPSPAKSSRKSPRKPLDALGFCKICQLPLVCIKIPEIQHTRECEVPSDSPECPDGVMCKSSDRMHYTSYNHSELARLRANDSDIKVLDNSEPSEQVTVEPDLPIGNKSGSKKVHDNPFLCESSDDDISADYNSERNGQPDEEEFEAEVVPDNQEAQEDEIVHPCIGGICDENKLSVSITSNGETVTFCVNEENNRWDNGGCKDCSGIVSSSCICGKNLALEMLSKEVFFKKQMEGKN